MNRQPAHNRVSTERARELRRNMTVPEQKLWRALRNRRLAGLKFVRQPPVGPYIADFACREHNLIVELDGESHADTAQYDRKRQTELEQRGHHVLRVSNDDVLNDIETVLAAIVQALGLNVESWRNGEYGQLPEDVYS